jgi:hypothetical protein
MTAIKISVSTSSQRERLLKWLLEVGYINTQEAREQLDIQAPAPRIMELKRQGYDIKTEKTEWLSHAGIKHKIARYVLKDKAE